VHRHVPVRRRGVHRAFGANRYDTVRQLLDSQHRYKECGPDGILTRTSMHRLQLAYLYLLDLRRLSKQAGFQLVQIAGGFDGRRSRKTPTNW
jgi:hypothetical protein